MIKGPKIPDKSSLPHGSLSHRMKRVKRLTDILSLPLFLCRQTLRTHTHTHPLTPLQSGPNSGQGLLYGNFQAAVESERLIRCAERREVCKVCAQEKHQENQTQSSDTGTIGQNRRYDNCSQNRKPDSSSAVIMFLNVSVE